MCRQFGDAPGHWKMVKQLTRAWGGLRESRGFPKDHGEGKMQSFPPCSCGSKAAFSCPRVLPDVPSPRFVPFHLCTSDAQSSGWIQHRVARPLFFF